MRYLAVATDYDGTLANAGRANPKALAMLQRPAALGCKLILVTGRELPDLRRVFPEIGLFDRVVAENGALLFDPDSEEEAVLCEPVSTQFIAELRQRGVPFSTGRAIVATEHLHEDEVRAVIQQLGLKLQVILNKGSVMVLPTGVDKASGLKRALEEWSISPQSVVAVGDAENDEALLAACGLGVAVANAVPALKTRADLVTQGENGAGVAEAIARIFDK